MKLKKGFTLIELLVVIAIIAMLLAILMPGLKKAKEVAKNIVCRTNVRSLTLGFRLYTDENNQKLIERGTPGSGNESLWLMRIKDQVGDINKVRYCPSTKKNPFNATLNSWSGQWFGSATKRWIWGYDVKDEPQQGSYTYNTWLFAEKPFYVNNWDLYGWQTPNPPDSSNVPIFADGKWVDTPCYNNQPCPNDINLDTGGDHLSINSLLLNRHRDKINVGFLDGHAESVQLKMLWSLKWGKHFDTLGPQTRMDGSPIYQR